MSFGKRTTGVSRQLPLRTTPTVPPDDPPSPLWGQLRRLGVGVAVGLCLIVGSQLLFMPMLGRSVDKRFEEDPATTALSRTSLATSQALLDACPPPTFGMELPRRSIAASELTQVERDIVAEGRKVQRMSRHLVCVMQHDLERLCNAKARSDLALLLKTYLGMRRDGERFANHVVKLTVAAPEAHLREQALRSRGDRRDNDPPRVDAESRAAVQSLIEIDSQVVGALQTLIRDGYVAKSTFSGFLGMFTPAELAPHLEGVTAERNACK